MADAGDALPLKGGGGGVEGPGGAEQQMFDPPRPQLPKEIAGENRGGTAAAGAPAVDILALAVEYQPAAVGVAGGEVHPVPAEQLAQQLAPQLPKVAGDNAVVEVRSPAGVLEVGAQGVVGRG